MNDDAKIAQTHYNGYMIFVDFPTLLTFITFFCSVISYRYTMPCGVNRSSPMFLLFTVFFPILSYYLCLKRRLIHTRFLTITAFEGFLSHAGFPVHNIWSQDDGFSTVIIT